MLYISLAFSILTLKFLSGGRWTEWCLARISFAPDRFHTHMLECWEHTVCLEKMCVCVCVVQWKELLPFCLSDSSGTEICANLHCSFRTVISFTFTGQTPKGMFTTIRRACVCLCELTSLENMLLQFEPDIAQAPGTYLANSVLLCRPPDI